MPRSLVYGLHAAQRFLESSPERVVRVLIDERRFDARMQAVVHLAEKFGLTLERVTGETLKRATEGGRHQGVLLEVTAAALLTERDLRTLLEPKINPLVLVLDNVQDPHNLGAILRTAAAAEVDAVLLPSHHASPITATARKVASGAVELLSIVQVTNLARALDQLAQLGIWSVGASEHAAQDIYATDLRGPIALVLGAEGAGLRRLTAERCDILINIPARSDFASLNVSVAAGICLFEARRQRRGG